MIAEYSSPSILERDMSVRHLGTGLVLATLLSSCLPNALIGVAKDAVNAATDGTPLKLPSVGSLTTVVHEGKTIEANETWKANVVHLVKGDIHVEGDNSPTLTIEPGAVVRFAPGTGIWVGYNGRGALVADGDNDHPIFFTSDSPSPAKGDWQALAFYAGNMTARSVLDHVVVEYGGGSDYGNVYVHDTSLTITNSELRSSKNWGVKLEGKDAHVLGFHGNRVHDNAGNPVRLTAENVHELHHDNRFSGNGVDRIYVDAGTVGQTATWQKLDVPYHLTGDLHVHGDASPVLSIAAGTTLLMGKAVGIWIGYSGRGGLHVDGTAEQTVHITSDSPAPSAGDWQALGFYDGTIGGSYLNHFSVGYGGDGYGAQVFLRGTANVEFKNGKIHHSKTGGIKTEGDAAASVVDVTFEGNGGPDQIDE